MNRTPGEELLAAVAAAKQAVATAGNGYSRFLNREGVALAAAEAAVHAAALEPGTAATWRDFERLAALVQAAPFRLARTMPHNPHHYTLRKTWPVDTDWCWAVNHLRTIGYTAKYGGAKYVQIDINEHFYWTMGYSLFYPGGEPCTILINRKGLPRKAAYDTIAGRYDEMFRGPAAQEEQAATMDMIDQLGLGPMSSLSVLDVGCGTGMLLRHRTPAQYLGVDPSGEMLTELRRRHPHAATVRTPLARFAAAAGMGRYDLVLSLFGVGSYLSDEELERIPLLLKPGGRAVTMFYAPGFTPEQYRPKKAVQVERRAWVPGLMRGVIAPDASADFVTVLTRMDDGE